MGSSWNGIEYMRNLNPRSDWSPDLFKSSKVIWRRGKKLKATSMKSIVAGYQLSVFSGRMVALGSNLPKKMYRVMGFSINF